MMKPCSFALCLPIRRVFSVSLVWLNIAVQTAFPLAVAFTPAITAAAPQQRTQVYTLAAGENAASVAKKYNLTLEQLRQLNQLNQFLTFTPGLNGLRPGDEVDVPVGGGKIKKYARRPALQGRSPPEGRKIRLTGWRPPGKSLGQRGCCLHGPRDSFGGCFCRNSAMAWPFRYGPAPA